MLQCKFIVSIFIKSHAVMRPWLSKIEKAQPMIYRQFVPRFVAHMKGIKALRESSAPLFDRQIREILKRKKKTHRFRP